MRKPKGVSFALQKMFFAKDVNGIKMRYIEPIAYFSDLNSALREKAKHSMSFVFPFRCTFYVDRRRGGSLIRANYHRQQRKSA